MKQRIVGIIALVLVTVGWSTRSVGEQMPAPRGELRIVDKNPANWAWIVYNVFETLMEVDLEGKLVPKLATGWRWLDERTLEVTLRQGVKFHNGEVFDAEIVQLNMAESAKLQHPYYIGEYLHFDPGSRLEIVDPHMVRFIFPAPDGAALAKLSFLHMGSRQFHRELGWGKGHW
jgi:ABC-type transport system substrate-binding protein